MQLGPAVCGACYEVPGQMLRDVVEAAVPGAATTTRWGTPAPRPARRAAPRSSPDRVAGVTVDPACTVEDAGPLLLPPRRRHRTDRRRRTGFRRDADARTDELAANLADVRARIDAACRRPVGDPATVTLVAVTKTWPAEDVRRLARLGVTDVGENRDQEAAAKAAALPRPAAHVALRRSGPDQQGRIGRVLRRRRARRRPARGSSTPSSRGAREAGRRPARAGPGQPRGPTPRPGAAVRTRRTYLPVADAVAAAEGLDLARGDGRGAARRRPGAAFGRLAEVAGTAHHGDHPAATWLSAGMSGDFEAAITAGATHVRVGYRAARATGPRSGSLAPR